MATCEEYLLLHTAELSRCVLAAVCLLCASEGFVVFFGCILFFELKYVEMNIIIFTITEVLGKISFIFKSAVVAFIVGT